MDQLTITKIGTASFDWDGIILDNVYTFVHDMEEPYCEHFNNQHPITLLQEDKNEASFKKKYTHYFSSITLNHLVKRTSQGFEWKINRILQADQLIPCRFGITFPLSNPVVENKNGQIRMSLINYQREWRQDFRDQTNIDLPILKITIANKPAYITLPFTEDVQFFLFTSEQQYFLKVSTLNSCDMQLPVSVSFDLSLDFLDFYCDRFPRSRNYVYQFNTLSRKIREKFGICILSHQSIAQYGILPPTEEELESYIVVLEENFNFYPKKFFEWLGLAYMSICGHPETGKKIYSGLLMRGRTPIFNASSKMGKVLQAKAIHHEIFHMIENKLSPDKSDKLNSMWDSLPVEDKFTEHFMGNEQPGEYRADLFATFVLDPKFVQNLADVDPTVKTKLQVITSLFAGISKDCSDTISTHTRYPENTLTQMCNPRKELKKKPLAEPMKKRCQLCGIKHSCLSSFGMSGIEINSSEEVPAGNLAYITLNPLDYCAIEYIRHKVPVEKSLETWISIHNKFEQADFVLHLKTEDVLKADIMTIREFWRGAGMDFDVEKVWKIKDELRISPLDTIPMLKNTWDLFRDSPVIARVGYGDISFED